MTEFKIDDIEQNNTSTNKERWFVYTSLGKMSLWSRTLANDILEHCVGKHVDGTYKDTQPYGLNLISINEILPDIPAPEKIKTPSFTTPASGVYGDAKERRIVRQAALKASVEMYDKATESVEMILTRAQMFEDWVYRD